MPACYLGNASIMLMLPNCDEKDMANAVCDSAQAGPLGRTYIVCVDPINKKVLYSGYAVPIQET